MSIELIIKAGITKALEQMRCNINSSNWHVFISDRDKRNRKRNISIRTFTINNDNYHMLTKEQKFKLGNAVQEAIKQHEPKPGYGHNHIEVNVNSTNITGYFNIQPCARPLNGPVLYRSDEIEYIKDTETFKKGTVGLIDRENEKDVEGVKLRIWINKIAMPIPDPWPVSILAKREKGELSGFGRTI
jgi:hypothetical protein